VTVKLVRYLVEDFWYLKALKEGQIQTTK